MNCLNCNKETTNPSYCSRSCAAICTNKLYPKKKTKKTCTICGKPVASFRYSRCPEHHQEYMETRFDYIQHLTLNDYWSKSSVANLHPSSKSAHIRILARSHFKDLIAKPCYNCGYDKHVELCHIKGVRTFDGTAKISEVNSYKNLIQLCRNCHWEFDHNMLTIDLEKYYSTL